MNCTRCFPNPPKLVFLEIGQSLQTSNGFLIAKVSGSYCPRCAGSYAGRRPHPKHNGHAKIKEAKGNLLQADAEALVNTVNCVGFMGKGIALQFKQAWPENFEVYAKACAAKLVQPGKMFVFETGRMVNPKYIINFPTKRHWRGKSRMEDIRSGLKALISEVRERRIQSIAVPPLGCGNGGLNWREVKPLITKAFAEVPSVEVLLFAQAPILGAFWTAAFT